MLNIIKIILFVLVNAAGAFVVPTLANLALMMDVFPSLPIGPIRSSFGLWLGAHLWVWGLAALGSIGYFFVNSELKTWLLLAPLYMTAIYGVAVLVYFNFIISTV